MILYNSLQKFNKMLESLYFYCILQVLYVMQLSKDGKKATVTSVSEFVLAQPCLSFAVSETCAKLVDPSHNVAANLTTGKQHLSIVD